MRLDNRRRWLVEGPRGSSPLEVWRSVDDRGRVTYSIYASGPTDAGTLRELVEAIKSALGET